MEEGSMVDVQLPHLITKGYIPVNLCSIALILNITYHIGIYPTTIGAVISTYIILYEYTLYI